MNNSWLKLERQDPVWMLPDDLAARDAFGARDCGWVEQMRPFIGKYSKPGDIVLDPFCGFGTTLVAAHLEGRRGIGLEVEDERVAIANERLARLGIATQEVRQGSLNSEHASLPQVDLVLTNLPYFGCSWTGNTASAEQLYGEASYVDHLEQIRKLFVAMKPVVKEGGHIVAMVENLHIGHCFVPYAWDVARLLSERFAFLDEVILIYDKRESPATDGHTNRAHEYALVARKESKPIDLDETLSCLQELVREYPEFVVYGSFARKLTGQALERAPSDADLLVPYKPELLRSILEWFEGRGFRVTRWGVPLHSSLAAVAMHQAHYFRVERITKDGKLCLIDLCFEDVGLTYEQACASSTTIGSLRVYK